jgi:ribosome-associated protein
VYAHSVEGRRQGEWILLDYVDFVVHVFLVERRAFYDIERLRKSARPLTPAEFDEELKAELAAKTRAARGKAARREQAATQTAKATELAKATQTAKAKKAAKKAGVSSAAGKAKAAAGKKAATKATRPG